MEKRSFFVYSWHVDPKEKDVTVIRAYGLNTKNENICIIIQDFKPYVYVELPEHITWNQEKAQKVSDKLDDLLGKAKSLTKTLVFKHRLYYAHIKDGKRKLFPYLLLTFSSKNDINKLTYALNKCISILGLGVMRLKVHEGNASEVLQLVVSREINTAGWVSFIGRRVPEDEKITHCDHEYIVGWKTLKKKETNVNVKPLIMSYDWEVYSSVKGKMPNPHKPGDKMFQCSCVFARQGEGEEKYEKYLLTLGKPDQETTGKNVIIRCFESEIDLLDGYSKLIREKQPNIICGYNIFTFDIDYMIQRAKDKRMTGSDFDRQGFLKYESAIEKTISWSSSAYKNQSFLFLDAEGRLFVDLLPLVRRDYKMDTYSLKSISTYFLGETKDPLSANGIFKCYRLGMKGGKRGEVALGVVGKYCVQDSALVLKLFDKLQTWFGLTEMAKVCNVPIFTLYTQGQQIKVFSQMYKKCFYDNYVVEKDGYIPKEDEHYQGAHVFDPVPGVYDKVVPFDFASLYPSVIIAYNICYSTLVTDESIPDSECHLFEWDEHVGCSHEEKKRKSKPKHVLCGHRKFRFLKSPPGILPTTIKNLLDARKATRVEIKELEKKLKENEMSDKEREEIETLLVVLDKRQLSLKISANSMYGAMGVQRGYLPFMPGAMCTTARGRESIELVAKVIPEKYGGQLVYGDTDSNYVHFPHLHTAQEIWKHAEFVSEEVSKLFPKPMKLEFEGVIYWRFLILTMKRYMSLKCDRNGNITHKIEKKGVLLSRRDNSNFVRTVYSDIVMKIFDKETEDTILYDTIQNINKLFYKGFSHKDFIITKSVGNAGSPKELEVIDKKKVKMGDYKVPVLSEDKKEREKQLEKKNASTDEEYYLRCLPAQVQLAEKMRARGQRVDVGTRLEFVITASENKKAKQYEKIESAEYYAENSELIKLDYMYYLEALMKPADQIFGIIYNKDDFVKKQCKLREMKMKMLDELKRLFTPKIIIEE